MKRAKLLPVTLVMALMLTLPAHAFSEPELSLNYYYYPETYTAQFINKLSTTTDLSYVSELMVNLFVYNMATQDVLCNSNNVMRNPSIPWITVSWSGANELKPGYYKDEGYGMLKYGEILGWDPEVAAKEYVFHHTGKSNVYSADVTGSENAFVERGIQIASEFRNVPSSYSCYTHDQMKDFLGATAYFCDLLPQMHLCFNSTINIQRIFLHFLSSQINYLRRIHNIFIYKRAIADYGCVVSEYLYRAGLRKLGACPFFFPAQKNRRAARKIGALLICATLCLMSFVMFLPFSIGTLDVLNGQHGPIVFILLVCFTITLIEIDLMQGFDEVLVCMGQILKQLSIKTQNLYPM